MALILTFSQREKGLRGISCITPMTVNQSHPEQVLDLRIDWMEYQVISSLSNF